MGLGSTREWELLEVLVDTIAITPAIAAIISLQPTVIEIQVAIHLGYIMTLGALK